MTAPLTYLPEQVTAVWESYETHKKILIIEQYIYHRIDLGQQQGNK